MHCHYYRARLLWQKLLELEVKHSITRFLTAAIYLRYAAEESGQRIGSQ